MHIKNVTYYNYRGSDIFMGKTIKKKMTIGLSLTLILTSVSGWSNSSWAVQSAYAAEEHNQATGVNVQYRTQDEIREYVKNNGATQKDALKFAENPLTEAPYALGRLSDETLNSAVSMLNQIRYIAGIDDNVQLSDKYTELTQAAALANYANNELSHFPAQPEGMSDEMYAKAKEGASSSNIAWASWKNCSMNDTIVSSWMEDGDSFNIDRLGHRRWLLNPAMEKTGFGAVSGTNGTYSAVYAFDGTFAPTAAYGVMWPAQNMPIEYFGKIFPWSISMGYSVDKSKIQVKLTRESDGKEWNFSEKSADGAFYVNNDYYGQIGCIIFRPELDTLDSYNAGDTFKVEITGLSEEVSYTVNFFGLNSAPTVIPTEEPTATPTTEPTLTPTIEPTLTPTTEPTLAPTTEPTLTPTIEPTAAPTTKPTFTPTIEPTLAPTETPATIPTTEPTTVPTEAPTNSPTMEPNFNPVDLSDNAKVTLNKTSYIYNGKAKKPVVTVTAGVKTLTKKADYTVSYKNNVNVGTASVVITGTGDYTGSVTITFKILPKGISTLGKIKAKSKGFTANWKKQTNSTTGYQLQYSTSKKFTGNTTVTKTIGKASTTKLTVSKLKAKKKYYVRIRTYKTVNGQKYYSSWSITKSVSTKK